MSRIFVVLKPDKTPMSEPFLDMADAQRAIEKVEPDLILQAGYQIHPITSFEDLKRLNVKPMEKVRLEKFDGDYVGQAPVEVIEF